MYEYSNAYDNKMPILPVIGDVDLFPALEVCLLTTKSGPCRCSKIPRS